MTCTRLREKGLLPAVLLLAGILAAPAPVAAQAAASADPFDDYRRLRALTTVDPWGAAESMRRDTAAPIGLLPVTLRLAHNSARPWGWNDGALWQGRGATVAASAGVKARWRWLSAALAPIAMRAANGAFALSPLAVDSGLSEYSYRSRLGRSTLDMPQRFGDGAFETFDLGQSFVRADVGPVAFGLSNENLRWGPARRNAIIMSDNAPGFGHAFLGTSRPANVRIGTLEARWHWGRLRESAYFDSTATNDSRYTTGLTMSFRPRGAPNLELGATRTFTLAWRDGGPDLDEMLLVFIPLQKVKLATPDNPEGNDATDQMASLFFRWAFPASGFELYGEWARGDHSWDLRDLLTQPEHASAFMLGFQKAIDPTPARTWRVAAEMTVLGTPRSGLVRPPASAFYQHHIIRQGWTQRGQVLGAGIGPGSTQNSVSLDRFAPWGKVGATILRTVYDNNRFYSVPYQWNTQEAEPALMLDALVFRGRWDLGASLTGAKLLNKHYVRLNDEMNVNANLTVRYHFGAH